MRERVRHGLAVSGDYAVRSQLIPTHATHKILLHRRQIRQLESGGHTRISVMAVGHRQWTFVQNVQMHCLVSRQVRQTKRGVHFLVQVRQIRSQWQTILQHQHLFDAAKQAKNGCPWDRWRHDSEGHVRPRAVRAFRLGLCRVWQVWKDLL